ncbi:hypothetical protein WOLCODRAFT_162933 [Wolfiporia cocos MD-104 SS10]|uniref:Uncharacterized protein n=1 Tax=Wolfiporia cocos (strain MD-104) TaxID=742152 RepID=A0A2H3JTV2_WOLCO|nr:hypothetical protein WOLCODRAFT_162933 [Wolfiporia cocos MD-104 SS10]
MASALHPPATNGGAASITGHSGSARPGLGKNGDVGAASRSTNKGRPGGRSGQVARGSRAGGGSKGGASPTQDQPKGQAKADLGSDKPASKETQTRSATTPSPVAGRAPGRTRLPKKAPENNKVSRRASTSSLTPGSAAQSNGANISSRSSNRRRRSSSKGVTTATSKSSLSAESGSGQPRSDQNSVLSKDIPPHLAPTAEAHVSDIKHDIEMLVERVRAVAMDRPHTPGSHIDWASDDDDSLPELPDWGLPVNTTANGHSAVKANVISPILEDALRPLPSLDNDSPTIIVTDVQKEVKRESGLRETTFDERGDGDVQSDATSPSVLSNGQPHSPTDHAQQASPVRAGEYHSPVSTTSPPPPSTNPIHSSLPPKPVTASEPTPTKRYSPPRKSEPDPALKADSPRKSGLADSIHAPKRTPVSPAASLKPQSPERGIETSIHAAIPSSRSAPSHLTVHPIGSPPNSHSGHTRSRTMGRGHRQPHSASVSSFSHSDADRGARSDGAHHTRTHSTPPAGSVSGASHTRSALASRPVITGAAISRLARTLGGSAIPKRDATAVTVAKD